MKKTSNNSNCYHLVRHTNTLSIHHDFAKHPKRGSKYSNTMTDRVRTTKAVGHEKKVYCSV